MRPAHDRWGIKKIVFTFCDDFMLKGKYSQSTFSARLFSRVINYFFECYLVLDLPWSQLPEWKELLDPIYDAIGINESMVVRSLLASMGPGVNIPVHHDTGYWVKHTHRCHVAIDTDCEKVDFMVGPNEDKMRKYRFDEGRIVELNNQAKHAVFNGMTDKYRTHLIFDYVDDVSLIRERLQLHPGEKVNQTRRSIDVIRSNTVRRQSPAFIIIGAQKCGTTSMYEYICQHPLVVKGKRRETHYFDWRFNHSIKESNIAAYGKAHHEYYMNFYEKEILESHPSLMTGESTPSYLLHADIVIPRMVDICPWVKLIVMLRNPIDRAFSQYQMCIDPNGTPQKWKVRGSSLYLDKTFDEVIDHEIAQLDSFGISSESNFETFQKYLATVPMNHGGHSIVARGLYVLQLEGKQSNNIDIILCDA